MKGAIIDKLWAMNHGLGDGMLLQKGDTWTKISTRGKVGYVYTKYLGYQTWYKGKGKPVLIANRENMPVYREDYEDGTKYPVFCYVPNGTIMADEFDEQGEYYVLKTGHDFLFIKKVDALIRR